MYVCVLIMNFFNLSDRKLGGYRELGQLPIDNIVSKHLIVCLSVQNSLRSQGRVLMRSKKSIAIFAYKHWLYSLDMKIKVARHVPRIAFQISKLKNIKFKFKNLNIWERESSELRADSLEPRGQSLELSAESLIKVPSGWRTKFEFFWQ